MNNQSSQNAPMAGEIWDAVLDSIRGREQAGYRPVLVISSDLFNSREGSLVIATPLIGTDARVRYQIEIPAGEGGVKKNSTILPEQIRAMDVSRLKKRRGHVSPETLARVREMVFILLSD